MHYGVRFALAVSALAMAVVGFSRSGVWADDFTLPSKHFSDFGSFTHHGMSHGGGGESRSGGGGSGAETYTPPSVSPQPPPEEMRVRRATELNNEGVELDKSGNREAGRSKYREALLLNPDDIVARQNLAVDEAELAFRAKSYDEAIERVRAAISLGRGNLGGRLADFQRERARVERQREIARHDAALTAAVRKVIDREKTRWAAGPPPPPTAVQSSDGDAKGNVEAYVTGVMEGATPGGALVGAVSSSAQAGSIYSGFALGILSDGMAALRAVVSGDDAGAFAHLQQVEQRVPPFQQETDQFVQQQFSNAAGQGTGEALIKLGQ
jgi:tetratricopeptide (TPR) repeat protein